MHFPHSISPRCDIYRARQQRAHYFPNFFSATAIPSRRFLAWKSNLWMINWLNRKIARNFRDITHRINLCPIKPGKIGRENKHPQVFLLSISLSLSPIFHLFFAVLLPQRSFKNSKRTELISIVQNLSIISILARNIISISKIRLAFITDNTVKKREKSCKRFHSRIRYKEGKRIQGPLWKRVARKK